MYIISRPRSQKNHRPPEIIGVAPTPGRDPIENTLTPNRIVPQRLRIISGDVTGCDPVHIDPLRSPFVCQSFNKAGERPLAGRISRNGDTPLKTQEAAGEDDL